MIFNKFYSSHRLKSSIIPALQYFRDFRFKYLAYIYFVNLQIHFEVEGFFDEEYVIGR